MSADLMCGRGSRGGVLLKLLLGLGLAFLVVAILWVVLLPSIVATTLRSRTGFAVQLDTLAVNPFTGRVTIKGLVLRNPAGWPVREFVELRGFTAQVELASLFSDRFVADEVSVDLALVTLVRDQEGRFNATAFQSGLAGGAAPPGAPQPGTPPARTPKRTFLIKHLVLKVDKLVVADHSGRSPMVREYNLHVAQDMRDVDSVAKLISPITGSALGFLSDALGGNGKGRPELLKDAADLLQNAGRKTGEKLKGLLDSLDKNRP